MTKLKVGIAGVTGYTGVELLKILGCHTHVEITALSSERSADTNIAEIFSELALRSFAARLPRLQKLSDIAIDELDAIFLCLPHKAASDLIETNKNHRPVVIDLSADFRLSNPDLYPQWYSFQHPCPESLKGSIYGLPEFNRAQLKDARIIANPGCYPTASLLGLLPLARAGAIDANSPIIIDAKSGVSGAGRKAQVQSLFAEVNENVSGYALGNQHRHVPEILQGLSEISSRKFEIVFSPHLIPITRGMIATMYVKLQPAFKLSHARAIFEDCYQHEAFVSLLPEGAVATINHVTRTNQCAISLHAVGDTLVVSSAIDNLLKGASGQAVQNFNTHFGLNEREGLL